MLRINVKAPPKGAITSQGVRVARAEKRAAHNAVDRASKDGQKRIGQAMKAAGLGRLDRAVGHTSSKRKGRMDERTAWGTVYARGGDESLAGGALEAYSRGVTIRTKKEPWLWFSTKAIPRRVGRYRMTPARYNRSGLVQSIGPLVFRRIRGNLALLVIRKVTLSPKTGRAKARGKGKTRTRIPVKEVVAFVGIRNTRRAKRFDHLDIMRRAANVVPLYMKQEMEQLLPQGG